MLVTKKIGTICVRCGIDKSSFLSDTSQKCHQFGAHYKNHSWNKEEFQIEEYEFKVNYLKK
jgi:hypothetical protein